MSDFYDDNALWVARAALARSIAGGDEARLVLDAVAPLIAAKALRDEAGRTYTHTMISQSGERVESQRSIWTHGDRAILQRHADEIGGVR